MIKHHNRSAYNWLIYHIGDKFLVKYSHLFQGDLYDLGCGKQPYKHFFLQYCDTYTGVDWNDDKYTAKADFLVNLNGLFPFENSVADTVVSFSVIEHLSEPQIMLKESFRILRSNGHIVLQIPFQWHVHEAPYDFYRYTRYGLLHILEKAGFVDIQIQATTGFWVMWFLKLNYQSARAVRGPKLLRFMVRAVLIPFWWLNQHCAAFLDQIWPNSEGETAGYFAIARKP